MQNTVIIESRYSGETEEEITRNIEYALECQLDSINRGEAPFVPHLQYTRMGPHTFAREIKGESDKLHKITREQGMACTRELRKVLSKTVFYIDLGWSKGMLAAKEECIQLVRPFEYRRLRSPPRVLYLIAGPDESRKREIASALINSFRNVPGNAVSVYNTAISQFPSFPVVIATIEGNAGFDSCDVDGRSVIHIFID